MPSDDRFQNLEFSFSGFAEGFEGDSRGYVENLNGQRDDVARRIEREIIDLLGGPGYLIRRDRLPERPVRVEIRFRYGSLLWDGWVTIHDAFNTSYFGNTVLNDVAIVGGFAALVEPLRKMIGKCVDTVVRDFIGDGRPMPAPELRTHVVLVTQLPGSARVLQRLDDLERRIEVLREENRHRWQMALAIMIIIVLLALLAGSFASFTWYVRFH